ncbi:YciK family oxidoreductase [Marinomonas aquiplantarum]|uniref:NAD(P)-dependent dehydrogenase (Short-subunit alcohol dehydrogenase family) n=1 Tax=Marinomonas aquiplantarum TaxID=491951 RepID=A0A366CWS5_9GAMM|nr:YciK family oxidoreductase [Marinomonas aquiplantarum]RBO82270.1 NAD(P)-dependent dehydrogenase (short-subunit alcohol dehydrogenase family) [Marinomonas aquiplantarum]
MFDYQAPSQLLSGKIILVTGAGDGIGKAASLAYAKHGATVILLGRTTKKLEAVYDEIERQGYPQAAIVPLNLDGASEHEYLELANTLKSEFGQLDGILHNASLLGDRAELKHYDPTLFEQVMRVNVMSQLMLTQALFPLLEQSPAASIIFTSSGVGRTAKPKWGAYAVSKFATEAMMGLFASELSDSNPNIRANAINPGATRTAMRASAYPDEDPQTLATADDIMPLYLYLMGKDSLTINGQSINAQ